MQKNCVHCTTRQAGSTRQLLYSGYFSRGNIFMVFVFNRQTTNFLPTKVVYTVLCQEYYFHILAKIHFS